jgi:murein L,D-transpeptidase YcbB/YkuD
MVAKALQLNTVEILTSTAYVCERMGYFALAADLRSRAKALALTVPSPKKTDWPNATHDPNMPAALAEQVARQLAMQGDPTKLDELALELRRLGYPTTAGAVEAKALQIRAQLDLAATLKAIDNTLKQGGAVTTPVPVPTVPVPGSIPVPKSAATLAAVALAFHINELISRQGSPARAKNKESRQMVQAYQAIEGLTKDGIYGPSTALALAAHVSVVPPPLYWPKDNRQAAVSKYKAALGSLADQADARGDKGAALALRASASKSVAT